jgi:methionyl aminopeptidase
MGRSRRLSRRSARPPVARSHGPVPKTPGEIEAMAASGALLAACHDAMQREVVEGLSTGELDARAEQFIRDGGGIPAFKGFNGFPGSTCPSVNTQVVHAIPGDYRLAPGDILSLDMGVVLDGWVSDAARTHAVGEISGEARRLMSVTEASLECGIAACRAGNHVGDIGHAVQTEVEAAGFSVIQTLVGHGIGRSMHEEPQVPNFGRPGQGVLLVEGMVIAIEPMVNAGGPDVVLDDDGWTITTKDGSLSAHFEHTVAITSDGPRVLTASTLGSAIAP